MSQTRLGSFYETCMNVVIGWTVALSSQLVIFPMVGINIPLSTNIEIGAWFTLISLVRSYVIRRWFNAKLHRAAQRLAGESV